MIEQSLEYVLLAFSKQINKRSHCKRPETTVTGNVILQVSSITVEKFNIPVFTGTIDLHQKVSAFLRERNNKFQLVDDYERLIKTNSYKCRPTKLIHQKKSYTINFPYFFNRYMIDRALFLMLTANREDTTYQVLPRQNERAIEGIETSWGRVWLPGSLVATNNTEKSGKHFGRLTLAPPSRLAKI